jgi:choice-of-anchor B domain-containing protein
MAPRVTVGIVVLLLAAPIGPAAAATDQPAPTHASACIDGFAEGYACANVDLAAHVGLAALGAAAGQDGNDIWGWTDAASGREFALVGVGNGTAFVEVTVPHQPVVLGLLPTQTGNSLWRDIKVHADHAFIVSEASSHGMQVFDLSRLLNVPVPPVTFSADAHYAGFGRAHNIAINEATGYAFAVGSRQGATPCSGGLHMIDIAVPLAPQFAGCFAADGYTHDTHCVVYDGPDRQHRGREICFSSNEDTLTIVDVTDKSQPLQLARVGYPGSAYSHQGWLAPGHRWFLMNDELDELNHGHNTRTYVWDLQDLDNPQQVFAYTAAVAATDHNLYIRGRHAYLANYKSGLRILDLSAIAQGQIEEVAYFDTYPANDSTGFDGAWSSYPFFDSGTVLVSDISRGLFVLQPRLCDEPDTVAGLAATPAGDQLIELAWLPSATPGVSYEVFRETGGCDVGPGEPLASGIASPAYSDNQASGQVDYGYRVRAVAGKQCRGEFSACMQASTSGACTAPPQFAGLASASTPGAAHCVVDLEWPPATPACTGPIGFELHRSQDPEFLPTPATVIATLGDVQAHSDFDVVSSQAYHYLVRARDVGNDAAESNLVRRTVTPVGPGTSGTWSNGAEQGEAFTGGTGIAHLAWHTTDAVAHSGQRSYASGYFHNDCIALTTPPIDLGTAGGSMLVFQQRYGIEAGWDGARVEISSDGATWQPLTPAGGYPRQISNTGNACGWPIGTGVYGGSALGWHPQTVDLSAHAGTVRLRWVLSTDGLVADAGWWVDTISVSPAIVTGSCATKSLDSTLAIDAHAPDPSPAGSAVTVAFTLAPTPPGLAVPTGSVTISAGDGAESCVAVLPQDGCDLTLLQPGPRLLTASYSGDATFPPTVSGSVPHQVIRADPGLSLSAPAVSVELPAQVTVTLGLAGVEGLPAPTGTIVVGSNLEPASCTIELPATDCSLLLAEPGHHRLDADYPGDDFHAPAVASAPHWVAAERLFFDGFEAVPGR